MIRRFLIAACIAAVSLLAGCASFTGTIPIESDAPEAFYISPKNADGIKDSLAIALDFPEIKGLTISSYEYSIQQDNGSSFYSYSERAERPPWYKRIIGAKAAVKLPREIVWDGRGDTGDFAPDGKYYMLIRAEDTKGNRGEAGPFTVIVDDTPPAVHVMLPYTVFSPNGDNNRDTLDIYFRDASLEETWEARIRKSDNTPVLDYSWQKFPMDTRWDGRTETGELMEDGEYIFSLSSTDLAGNSFSWHSGPLLKESALPPISARLSDTILSPNGDGIKDSVILYLDAETPDRIVKAGISVIGKNGASLASLPAPSSYPTSVTINGIMDNGRPIPDGIYYIRFNVEYRNGAVPSTVTPPLLIDTAPPSAVVSVDYRLLSPDGDGRRDELSFYQSSEEASAWSGTITDQSGRTVYRRDFGPRAPGFVWNGRDSQGRTVPDGVYTYSLQGADEAGNRALRRIDGIRIDTRPTPVALRSMDASFSPNGDGITETARFTPVIEITEGISSWLFEITDSKETAVFALSGRSYDDLPRTLLWTGEGAPEGLYGGRLTAEYEKGNIAVSVSPEQVALDISGPGINAQVSSLPFGPDGDGVNDRLMIRIAVDDPSGIILREAEILDPAGNAFLRLPAAAFTSAGWSWDGKSASGELVQSASDYTLVVRSRDTVGNESRYNLAIPVDILVIRDGDRLKISISSIYFKPNTPDYSNVEPETAKRNLATLDRLAEILKKYADYRIKLEGHGVRIYWDQPQRWLSEETEVLVPLSRARAEAIRSALSSRGVKPERMSIEGFGGYRPVVPHGDLDNRWKNRRVEFILVK
ncbi:FlgD immunoglobulin-like domain containing protein [Marispirochaeta aestuarii]|uniref:FlgD immunoglobulin-like domain containing protein n=1 Tax=Marispirochaeta aestuarii TaxID=1963862 RepID=UPI002ABE1A3A|nr:FlgD immunoglobulin-like domain containing protein [Marispirochaeta aestuarii]